MLELVYGFPLRLSRAVSGGTDKIMELWREFCAEALAFVEPGRYGTPLQNQLCRLTRQMSVVFALFREVEGDTHVLLRLRKPEEPYGNQYCPEANVCFVWETDEALIDRMLQNLGVVATQMVHLSPADNTVMEERGNRWHHSVFAVQVAGDPELIGGREWVSIKNLPANIVPHHRVAITAGLKYRQNPGAFDEAMKVAKEALGL
jgi:hypothetical protein